MPFRVFPSTPFDPFVPNNLKYGLKPNTSLNAIFKEPQYINPNRVGGLGRKKFLHQGLGGNYDDEQFTIIILTYKREKLLSLVIDKYFDLPYLHKIVVVWNDLEVKPTGALLFKYKKMLETNRLVFIQSVKNKIDNRMLPYSQIQTDCVLLADDDSPLRNDEISLGFRTWRENRHRIVGFPMRFHSWSMAKQKNIYMSKFSCEYSLILTGAVFYHRFYNYIYTYVIDQRLRDLVERVKNCDDLVFNYMVAQFTRLPPIKVTSRSDFTCQLCEQFKEFRGISHNFSHYNLRHDCLNYINSIYGYNPLLYSQTRIDSVGFGTDECFKHV
jgi:alpha-1,4-N-acetylglucosaminyltransferase EXTL3